VSAGVERRCTVKKGEGKTIRSDVNGAVASGVIGHTAAVEMTRPRSAEEEHHMRVV
jgi:outer membrane lipoprotein SlyB